MDAVSVAGAIASIAALIWALFAHSNRKKAAQQLEFKLRGEIFFAIKRALEADTLNARDKALEDYKKAIREYGAKKLEHDVAKAIAVIEREGSSPVFLFDRKLLRYEDFLPQAQDLVLAVSTASSEMFAELPGPDEKAGAVSEFGEKLSVFLERMGDYDRISLAIGAPL